MHQLIIVRIITDHLLLHAMLRVGVSLAAVCVQLSGTGLLSLASRALPDATAMRREHGSITRAIFDARKLSALIRTIRDHASLRL